MPRGLPRLAWRAGGLRLIAREATMARRLAGAVLFGAAAAFAAWAAWPGPPSVIHYWTGEVLFVLVIACYVAVTLAVTARRSSVTPATLAAGTSAGIGLGVAMYAVAPLGLTRKPSPGPPDGGRSARAGDDDILVRRVPGPEEDRERDLVGPCQRGSGDWDPARAGSAACRGRMGQR